MPNRQLQGWSADPFRLHEERYFSAGRATKLVRDGKVESYEDPPSDTYEVPDDEPEAEALAPVPAAAPGRYSYPVSPPAGVTGQYARVAPRATPGVRKRSRALLIVAATAIVAATVAGMLVLVKQESRSTSNPDQPTAISQVAFVRQSAAKTLAERTALVTLAGSVQSSGRTGTVSGTGEIDFGTNSMTFNLAVGAPGQLTEHELLVGGDLYIALTVSGTSLARLTGGRTWIELPVAQSESSSLVGSDPLSSLSLLEQQGIDVRPIGSKIVEGQSCTGYAVTPTKAALLASVRAEFARLGFSSAMVDQEVTLAQQMVPPTVTVWLDAQGLMREMSLNVSLQTGGSAAGIVGSMVIYVSDYGAQVQITAPPPSQVISWYSFLKAVGAKS
jgi:hypothetical protein